MAQKVKPHRILGFCPEGGWGIEPFQDIFSEAVRLENPKSMENIDCLLLFGGTDIHPSYYRQPVGRFTYPGYVSHPSRRDDFEYRAMLFCKLHDIPMIGLCRGAQFGTIMAGGSLIQHVTGHSSGDHDIETIDGVRLKTNSLHHQMMNPYGVPHTMLAWSEPPRSNCYLDGNNEEVKDFKKLKEPEIVYYPEIRFLAIQGHPEYTSAPKAFKELCCEYVREYLFDEVISQGA